MTSVGVKRGSAQIVRIMKVTEGKKIKALRR